jgi:hypothetical protein
MCWSVSIRLTNDIARGKSVKTVELFRTFDYRPDPRRCVRFVAGKTYAHVLERAAQAIEHSGAGRIVHKPSDAVGRVVDASQAFKKHAFR